jgi:hypothetical protein
LAARAGAPDVGIWMSRRGTGGWTPPIEMATGTESDGTRHPCWNPVLFEMAGGALTLFYKVGPSPQRWWGMVKVSRDRGRTWSDARWLPDGILGPIRTNRCGSLTDPARAEQHRVTRAPERVARAFRAHSRRRNDVDGDRTAVVCGREPDRRDPAEHSASRSWTTAGRRPHALWPRLRHLVERRRTNVDSADARRPAKSRSGIDAVTLRDGRHLIVYNHTERGRSPLNVSLSRDGTTWEAALVLEHEPGEFSYPAVIQTSDGRVHITYTWKRQRVKHLTIDPARLKSVPMRDGKWPELP